MGSIHCLVLMGAERTAGATSSKSNLYLGHWTDLYVRYKIGQQLLGAKNLSIKRDTSFFVRSFSYN